MKAVATLFRLYFAATPLTLGLTVLGLAIIAAGLVGYAYAPTWSLGTGMRSSALWVQAVAILAPWVGMMLLFAASALLPTIVARFAFGRLILVLPHGRLYVLSSALAAAGAIALVAASAGVLSFHSWPEEARPQNVFSRTWLVVFSNVSLMYLAIWIVGKTRGIWLLLGSLFIVLGVVLPLGLIGRPSGVPGFVWVGFVGWAAFAAVLLGGGEVRHALADGASRVVQRLKRLVPGAGYAAGEELALLLGTGRPGMVAVGQVVPILAAIWLIDEPTVYVFFLAIFAAISGAVTSMAASRSRVLWLRFGWTREELFRRVEGAYWRYNAYALGVLLLAFVAIGSYLEFATPVLALGVPLLVLGCAVSSYLGLVMTRGLRWREAALGVVTMLLLLYAAFAVDQADAELAPAVLLEAVLVVAALFFRHLAATRWQRLDWMKCRANATARGAA